MTTLRTLAIPLICAGIAATGYGIGFTIRALREKVNRAAPQPGRAFSLPVALVFALSLAAILIASAALREKFGETGVASWQPQLPASSTHRLRRHSRCFDGCIRKDDGYRCPTFLLSSRLLNQHYQQGRFCLEQREPLFCDALDPWPDPCRGDGVGRRATIRLRGRKGMKPDFSTTALNQAQ